MAQSILMPEALMIRVNLSISARMRAAYALGVLVAGVRPTSSIAFCTSGMPMICTRAALRRSAMGREPLRAVLPPDYPL